MTNIQPTQEQRELAERIVKYIMPYDVMCACAECKESVESKTDSIAQLIAARDAERENKLELAITKLKELCDHYCDAMEGAGMPEFQIYEEVWVASERILKMLGVDYNAISGKETRK